MCNERGTLSQTKQGRRIPSHHERTLRDGEIRLRKGVDVAPRGQQRIVRSEEQPVGADEICNRSIRSRR